MEMISSVLTAENSSIRCFKFFAGSSAVRAWLGESSILSVTKVSFTWLILIKEGSLSSKNGRPGFISEANWVKLIEYWMKNEWCVKSKHGTDNKKTLLQGSMATHTGESVSFAVTKKRLAEEKKRLVQFSEVFDRTHSDPRSIAAFAYKEKMKNKYDTEDEDVTAWPYNDDEVYLESMGKPQKGQYYGLGANTTLVPLSSQVGSSSLVAPTYDTSTSKDEIQLMRGDLNKLKDKFEAILEERDDKLTRMIVQAIDKRFSQGSATTPPPE